MSFKVIKLKYSTIIDVPKKTSLLKQMALSNLLHTQKTNQQEYVVVYYQKFDWQEKIICPKLGQQNNDCYKFAKTSFNVALKESDVLW